MKIVGGIWNPVGTGFFISDNGIFVTAWHVLRDCLDQSGRQISGIAAFHFIENNQYLIRPVLRSCHHRVSDIAVGVLAKAHHNQTGAVLSNKMMPLTRKEQTLGSEIVTWAFPSTKVSFDNGIQKVNFRPDFYSGVLEEHFPKMRDPFIMPFPSYRGSIKLLGGSSGGPVVNLETGRVFGVNCTGIDGTEVSHYASLAPIDELWIEDVEIQGQAFERVMIGDLIDKRCIHCD